MQFEGCQTRPDSSSRRTTETPKVQVTTTFHTSSPSPASHCVTLALLHMNPVLNNQNDPTQE